MASISDEKISQFYKMQSLNYFMMSFFRNMRKLYSQKLLTRLNILRNPSYQESHLTQLSYFLASVPIAEAAARPANAALFGQIDTVGKTCLVDVTDHSLSGLLFCCQHVINWPLLNYTLRINICSATDKDRQFSYEMLMCAQKFLNFLVQLGWLCLAGPPPALLPSSPAPFKSSRFACMSAQLTFTTPQLKVSW